MPKATESNSTSAGRPHFGPRTTTFDRAWQTIEDQARGHHKAFSPRGAARLYLLAERAAADAKNDDALDELGAVSTSRLERLHQTVARDVGDVAAKLAALIMENARTSPVTSGGLEAAIHLGMCSCLADLVVIGDGPLPDVSAVLDLREDDFELRDMSETEAAEGRAEAMPARDAFGAATIEADRLKSALAGWHEVLIALRGLAETRPITPDALDALLTEIAAMSAELDHAWGEPA